MTGRLTMQENRTLFLFIFATDEKALPETLDSQKKLLLGLHATDKWECPHILNELNGTRELYFARVNPVQYLAGRGAGSSSPAMRHSAFSTGPARFRARYDFGHVLAGELAEAGGRHETAFQQYEAFLRSYIDTKQAGAKRLGTKGPMGTSVSQSGEERICNPGISTACRWQGGRRRACAA